MVTNNFDTVEGADNNDEIDVKLDLSTVNTGEGDLFFIGTGYDESGNQIATNVADTEGDDSDTATIFTLTPNDQIYFVIQIETGNATDPSDFDGSVTFTVEPNTSS